MHLPFEQMIGVKRMPEYQTPIMLWADSDVVPQSHLTRFVIPTDNQHHFPACAGFATANWVEIMLRKTHGHAILKPGEQIDGMAIWRKARRMFWAHEPVDSGGLFMDQGFRAAVALGILPQDTVVEMVNLGVADLSRKLCDQPVLQGTTVSKAWSDPNPQNGHITFAVPEPGGHATCIIGVLEQENNHFILFQNSWGERWGWHGYGMLRSDLWARNLLGPLATARLSHRWQLWNGWRDYVVTVK